MPPTSPVMTSTNVKGNMPRTGVLVSQAQNILPQIVTSQANSATCTHATWQPNATYADNRTKAGNAQQTHSVISCCIFNNCIAFS